VRNKMLDTIAR